MTADRMSWYWLSAEIQIPVLEALLQEYDCTQCAPRDEEMVGMSNIDNRLFTTAFPNMFSALSTWEPNGNLLLDITLHSPSDSVHLNI